MNRDKFVYRGEVLNDIIANPKDRSAIIADARKPGKDSTFTHIADIGDCVTKNGYAYVWNGHEWVLTDDYRMDVRKWNIQEAENIAFRKCLRSDYCFDEHSVKSGAIAMAERKDEIVGNLLKSKYALLMESGSLRIDSVAEFINDIYEELFGERICGTECDNK